MADACGTCDPVGGMCTPISGCVCRGRYAGDSCDNSSRYHDVNWILLGRFVLLFEALVVAYSLIPFFQAGARRLSLRERWFGTTYGQRVELLALVIMMGTSFFCFIVCVHPNFLVLTRLL